MYDCAIIIVYLFEGLLTINRVDENKRIACCDSQASHGRKRVRTSSVDNVQCQRCSCQSKHTYKRISRMLDAGLLYASQHTFYQAFIRHNEQSVIPTFDDSGTFCADCYSYNININLVTVAPSTDLAIYILYLTLFINIVAPSSAIGEVGSTDPPVLVAMLNLTNQHLCCPYRMIATIRHRCRYYFCLAMA